MMEYLGESLFKKDEDIKKRFGRGKVITHISLFTGCGGLDVGFANAGIQTRVMVENAHSPCETLRCNFHWKELKQRTKENGKPQWKNKKEMRKTISWYHYPEPIIIEKDIRKVTTKEILEVAKLKVGQCSIISGGFPCQGFSLAGERVLEDPRNALYKEFVRIVDEAKPAMIFGENVPGLISMNKGKVMKQICEDFAECGYDITWDILNAADFGVPQNRKRVILIGKRNDLVRMREDGSVAIHIAFQKGKITHPELFHERLKKWEKAEKKLKEKK